MKFTTPLAFLCAISSASGLVIVRDLKTVTGALSSVQTGIDNLDAAFKQWTSDLAPLLDAANKLNAAITGGTSTVSGTTPLTLIEAIRIIRPVQELEDHAKTLVSTLKGKKQQIVQANLCQIISSQIGTIDTNSQALTKATVAKVPQVAQGVATQVAKGILDVLADAKNEFSAQNCK
ncbi:hypothetical protein QQS21_007141 [Conoideocrella luteorostrata]|uniref:Uncharacterized protein n=1 Tax=Conoideocrella luteorostrata TaxID=1105319 RepID=A0AAJ0CL74_9HYPO|nr:hypothetical protein QQS21_007141 [Conoideocrella luteorostrata]